MTFWASHVHVWFNSLQLCCWEGTGSLSYECLSPVNETQGHRTENWSKTNAASLSLGKSSEADISVLFPLKADPRLGIKVAYAGVWSQGNPNEKVNQKRCAGEWGLLWKTRIPPHYWHPEGLFGQTSGLLHGGTGRMENPQIPVSEFLPLRNLASPKVCGLKKVSQTHKEMPAIENETAY